MTIGVDDVTTSMMFYRDGPGLTTQGMAGTEFGHGAVVFFDLQNGLKLAPVSTNRIYGYFQDPGGHLWEIVWNSDWIIDA